MAFPPPPAFFELYRHYPPPPGAEEAAATAAAGGAPPAAEARVLPPGPPPPPVGEYEALGGLHTTELADPPLGIEQLFRQRPDGSIDHAGEVQRLTRELLFNYFDLISTLSTSPSTYGRRLEDIGTIARNMHYLLNQLRPGQARASLAGLLRRRIAERREAMGALRAQRRSAAAELRVAAAALAAVGRAELAAGVAAEAAAIEAGLGQAEGGDASADDLDGGGDAMRA